MSVYLSIYFIIHMKLRVFGRSAAVPVVRGRFFLGLQDTPARRSFRNSQESSHNTQVPQCHTTANAPGATGEPGEKAKKG